MKKILLSLLVAGLIGGAATALTSSFFADAETSAGNNFTAGAVDLKIDSTCHYDGMICSNGVWAEESDGSSTRPELIGTACSCTWEEKDLTDEKFFDFADVKPGDNGENTLSLHVDTNDAWACLTIDNLKNNDNACNEPEGLVDNTCGNPGVGEGELAQNTYFFAWSEKDGNNVYEPTNGEQYLFSNIYGPASDILNGVTYPLADSTTGGGPLAGNTTYYIGVQWCTGTMTVNTTTGVITCDGSTLGNEIQTDSLIADMKFYVEQARHNADFVCGKKASPTPTPSGTPQPSPSVSPLPSPSSSPGSSPVACVPTYVSNVIGANQGTLKNGSPIIDPTRTSPANALGPTNGSFFSIGKGGNITLAFAAPISNVAGYDLTLSVQEITGGRETYPEERADVAVSADNITYFPIGFATSEPGLGGDGLTQLDFAPTGLTSIQYVRLVDSTNFGPHVDTADGYDLDSVRGNCKVL